MTDAVLSRFLTLPGWLGSDQGHWQSRWEADHGCRRVEQDDWVWPKRGDWMARLDEVVLEDDVPVVFIAHSLGVHLVAHWAAHSQQVARVRAALLVAPPDIERDDMPPNIFSWRHISRQPLPFRALAVLSSDDPYCTLARGESMASDWGAEVTHIGARGHVNGDSALGDWPEGWALLRAVAS